MNSGRRLDRDIVVLGAGLAGLCFGIQLLLERPHTKVTLIERARFPLREAAHKVGESTVEIGALYFADVLGMRELLDETHLPKFGLRFFYGDGRNDDIAARSEFGLRDYLPVRTWQVDRGRFENQLAERFVSLGGELLDGSRVRDVELSDHGHTVRFETGEQEHTLTGRWVVDASGRTSFLKKRLGLAQRVRHLANAAWWRVPDAVDVDQWSSDSAYRNWVNEPRRLSTIHLMGESYWVWLIPLPSGGTSIGIVGEDSRHPFQALRKPEAADAWLREYEPQLAEVLASGGERQDHLSYKHYSYGVKQVLSEDRWALLGDAGFFLDPFYSPGSDFIGLSNTLMVDAITRALDGAPDASERIVSWNKRLLALYRAFLVVYRGRYPLMGRPMPMGAKILWDFSSYWSVHATVFASGRLTDLELSRQLQPAFERMLRLHVEVQNMLTVWGRHADAKGMMHQRFDYGSVPWLRELNGSLLTVKSDDVVDRVGRNLAQLEAVAASLELWTRKHHPDAEDLALRLPREAAPVDLSWPLA